ncbi:MAG: RDD family protein [Alphaproteobacteria bacterium]|nr:RDD family protein [Alphaproteobacteria bacterium]
MDKTLKKPNILLRRLLGSSLIYIFLEECTPFDIFTNKQLIDGQIIFDSADKLVITVLLLLFSLLSAYFVSSDWQGGLDKKLVNLKIVKNNGDPLSFIRAYIREFFFILPFFYIFFSLQVFLLISFFWYILCPLLTKGKKCFHDIICQTKVVDKDDAF